MQRLLSLSLLALLLIAGIGCDSAEDDDIDGDATITGVIVDSQEGDPIAGALVRFVRGSASAEATTDSTGTFTIDGIATGTYTVTIRANGFLDVVLTNVEITDGANTLPQTVATVAPPAGAFRIVLSWGTQPRDLDSHLTGPDGEDGRFHVYYADEVFGTVANLDTDDTSGEGPETITVTPSNDGMYRYSVHNFSDQSVNGSQGIAGTLNDQDIPARVQVYNDQGLVREYRAPAATPGDTWRVFEMNAVNGNATITDVNTYVDANGSGDIEAFRMPAK
ncbi:MAG: carboxypeptidase regulatory-like domain-containing protein [Rhodothermales bacterium]